MKRIIAIAIAVIVLFQMTGLPGYTVVAEAANDDLLVPRNLAEYYNALLPELIRKVMGISDTKAAAEMQEYLTISFVETKGSAAYYDSSTYEVEIGGYYEGGAPMVNSPSDALNISIVEDLQNLLKEVMCLYIQACDSTIDADALRTWMYSAKETGDRYPLNGYLVVLNHANGYWQYALLRDNTEQPGQDIEPQPEPAVNIPAQPDTASGVIFCPECGQKIAAGSKFCMYCGNRIPDVDSAPIARTTPAPTVNPAPRPTPVQTPKPTVTPKPTPKPVTLYPGKHISFGRYEQDNRTSNGKEAISWTVLAVDGTKALILSDQILEAVPFHTFDTSVRWDSSYLRDWLNNDFYWEAFTSGEQVLILSTYLTDRKNPQYGTQEGDSTRDKVFALSIEEVQSYLPTEASRSTTATEYCMERLKSIRGYNGVWWWLRSPGSRSNKAAGVYADSYNNGTMDYDGAIVDHSYNGVRPAMWIDAASFTFS